MLTGNTLKNEETLKFDKNCSNLQDYFLGFSLSYRCCLKSPAKGVNEETNPNIQEKNFTIIQSFELTVQLVVNL